IPHVERLSRRRREELHARSTADQRDDLLGHADDQFLDAVVLRGAAPSVAAQAGHANRGADRSRAVPGRAGASAAALAERVYDVKRWTVMPKGGHFAAMEEPELLAADVREFYRDLS